MARDLVIRHCDSAEAWHVAARSTLDRLDHQVRSGAAGARLQATWGHFVTALRAHFAEEEAVVFPALRTLAKGGLPAGDAFLNHLDDMDDEVESVRSLTGALRLSSRELGLAEQDFLDFIDDLEEHARREQEELLPAARALIADLQGRGVLDEELVSTGDRGPDPLRQAISKIPRSR